MMEQWLAVLPHIKNVSDPWLVFCSFLFFNPHCWITL